MGRLPTSTSDKSPPVPQAGAVPFRVAQGGALQVLLITNRAGEWIVPKGMIDPNTTPEQTALNEALEEAGVTGELLAAPLGHYEYEKSGSRYRVRLFALRVGQVLERWLERREREREWVSVAEAAKRIQRAELRSLVERLPEAVAVRSASAA